MLSDATILQIIIGFFLFQFLIVIAVIVYFKLIKKGKGRIYKAKGPYLLSAGEKKFFDALINVLNKDKYVCPKVRIADLVEVDIPKTDKNFWPSFNKVSQKHVDFVVCSRSDFSPLLIIELDGGSHNEKSQLLRDELVDKVFLDADIPIVHIKPKSFYDYKFLWETISEATKTSE